MLGTTERLVELTRVPMQAADIPSRLAQILAHWRSVVQVASREKTSDAPDMQSGTIYSAESVSLEIARDTFEPYLVLIEEITAVWGTDPESNLPDAARSEDKNCGIVAVRNDKP